MRNNKAATFAMLACSFSVFGAGWRNPVFIRNHFVTERRNSFKPLENLFANFAIRAGGSTRFGAGCRNCVFGFNIVTVFTNHVVNFYISANGAGMFCVTALGTSRFNNLIGIAVKMVGLFPHGIKNGGTVSGVKTARIKINNRTFAFGRPAEE